MRRLLPDPCDDVDPLPLLLDAERALDADRPWVAMNMIASVDGATALDGVSGGLGGPGDRAVFRAARASADVILVAAGTVRAEGYGPPSSDEEVAAARRARGRAEVPRIAVVSRSVDLDPDLAVFDPDTDSDRPLLVVPRAARTSHPERLERLADRATVLTAGDDDVDLTAALADLAPAGATVLVEGGPSLNGQLVAQGLLDELLVTLAPVAVGGRSPRLAHGPRANLLDLTLEHVLEEDGSLFLRYVRSAVA